MPDTTGFAIARQLKAVRLARCPVLIAISGVLFSSEIDQVVARSAGFDHFVRKGTDPGEVIRLINHYKNIQEHLDTLANRHTRREKER